MAAPIRRLNEAEWTEVAQKTFAVQDGIDELLGAVSGSVPARLQDQVLKLAALAEVLRANLGAEMYCRGRFVDTATRTFTRPPPRGGGEGA